MKKTIALFLAVFTVLSLLVTPAMAAQQEGIGAYGTDWMK